MTIVKTVDTSQFKLSKCSYIMKMFIAHINYQNDVHTISQLLKCSFIHHSITTNMMMYITIASYHYNRCGHGHAPVNHYINYLSSSSSNRRVAARIASRRCPLQRYAPAASVTSLHASLPRGLVAWRHASHITPYRVIRKKNRDCNTII